MGWGRGGVTPPGESARAPSHRAPAPRLEPLPPLPPPPPRLPALPASCPASPPPGPASGALWAIGRAGGRAGSRRAVGAGGPARGREGPGRRWDDAARGRLGLHKNEVISARLFGGRGLVPSLPLEHRPALLGGQPLQGPRG